MLTGAGIGAERAGVPSAALVHTVYPLPARGVPPFGLGLMPARGPLGRTRDRLLRRLFQQLFRPGLSAANAARSALGLEELDAPFDQILRANLVLVATSAAFDLSRPGLVPENVVFTGPVAEGAAPAPESRVSATGDQPQVLISFSTTYMRQQDLAQRALDAVGGLPVRGLLTTGPAIDADRLSAPGNVEVRDFVSHAAVLPETALVICHAGMGTVHAALSHGVPLVCIPCGRDQNDVAARVVFRGAGVRVAAGASTTRIRRAASKVLADPSYALAARRLSTAMAADCGASRAVEALEALEKGRVPVT
jgi:MGT family glycosyltransferase